MLGDSLDSLEVTVPRFVDDRDFYDFEVPDPRVGERDARSVPTVLDRVSPLKTEFYSGGTLVNGSWRDPARELEDLEDRANRSRPIAAASVRDSRPRGYSADWTRAKGFNPAGRAPWPSTLYGAAAQTMTGSNWMPVFRHPTLAIPCVERVTRRQVMFAKRRAGRGHRKPKRRSWVSNIRC